MQWSHKGKRELKYFQTSKHQTKNSLKKGLWSQHQSFLCLCDCN